MATSEELYALIQNNTHISPVPLIPEFRLFLATELTPLWTATEAWLQQKNMDPPFWAFAWPGSIALARYILDHADVFTGQRILDFGSGCGLAALAAAKVGAKVVLACDIDPLAAAAMQLNAALNHQKINVITDDITGQGAFDVDIILAGDVCYASPMSQAVLAWLARQNARIWVADPGRAFFPDQIGNRRLEQRESYNIPVLLELERHSPMHTRVLERI